MNGEVHNLMLFRSFETQPNIRNCEFIVFTKNIDSKQVKCVKARVNNQHFGVNNSLW